MSGVAIGVGLPQPDPDYRRIGDAARNVRPDRTPIYEHIIDESVMESILGVEFAGLANGNESERREYFKNYCTFFLATGYDTVSFEELISSVLPESGALYHHREGAIRNRDDFERYPWNAVPDRFMERYRGSFALLSDAMPDGMKAIGGPGNGIFECVQDVVGYTDLCLIRYDDPQLYSDLFSSMARVFEEIWRRFLEEFVDDFAVCRFGDDLGFRSGLLLPPEDIRTHIIPAYARIISLVHEAGRPFLLHSCGNIFEIMEDLIGTAGIDAKHSNEDAIAELGVWIEKYGERIGNFGGVDTDVLCGPDPEYIERYVTRVMEEGKKTPGFALGSGNSIPDYVPPEGYLTMIRTACRLRE